MELSKATLELLRDEAYVILCREVLQEGVAALQREKSQIKSSRPPFGGVLAGKKARAEFESSLRTAEEREVALRSRLSRIEKYETWLHRCISRDLTVYLEVVSGEFQRVSEIKRLLTDWEVRLTRFLPDTLAAYARQMRVIRVAIAERGRTTPPSTQDLALLRELAERVEQQQDHLNEVSKKINALVLELALLDARMPSLPEFKRRMWVDSLSMLPVEQAALEVGRAESEIRAFLEATQPTVGRLQAIRVSCVQRQEAYLQQYWNQLRAHAQAHWVEERDVDEVLKTLAARYDEDINRRQREVTYNPFVPER